MLGMPRRIADYAAGNGWTELNQLSTIGSAILGIGVLPFLIAVVLAMRKPATEPPNPWGGGTLEWWTDSPPPPGNFRDLPPIRSNRPVLDAARAGGLQRDAAESPRSGCSRRWPSSGFSWGPPTGSSRTKWPGRCC